VFLLQKRIVRIMLGLGYGSSCRTWFKKYDILTVPCLCIISLAMFVIKHSSYFQTNLSRHGTDTRQKNQLYKPLIKFSSVQKCVVYSAINVFNKLSLCTILLQHNKVQFKNVLKNCLFIHTFLYCGEILITLVFKSDCVGQYILS
jgi:hypothetical protein